ncbi:MAG: hypothetical protein WKG07_07290 [Hymenobacter sp.]
MVSSAELHGGHYVLPGPGSGRKPLPHGAGRNFRAHPLPHQVQRVESKTPLPSRTACGRACPRPSSP